jgi:hypothetical protein
MQNRTSTVFRVRPALTMIPLLLALLACNAPSLSLFGPKPPSYPDATALEVDEVDLQAGLAEAELPLAGTWLFQSSTSVVWVDEDAEDTLDLIEDTWQEAGWDDQTLGQGSNEFVTFWHKDDQWGFTIPVPEIDESTVEQLDDFGIKDAPEGKTVIVSHVWDTSKPLRAQNLEALGWDQEHGDDFSFYVPPGTDASEDSSGITIDGPVEIYIVSEDQVELGIQFDASMTPSEAMETLLDAAELDVSFDQEKVELFDTISGHAAAGYNLTTDDGAVYIAAINAGNQYLFLAAQDYGEYSDDVDIWELLIVPIARMMAQSIEVEN